MPYFLLKGEIAQVKMEISWLCCKNNRRKQEVLEQLVPQDYSYKVDYFNLNEPIASITSENEFHAKLYVNVCSEEEVKTFVKSVEDISETYYNVNAGDKKGTKTLVGGRRKCQHKTRIRDEKCKDKVKNKNTNCPAYIRFNLAKHDHQENCQKLKYPLLFEMSFNHNHPVLSASAWSFHPVNDHTKATITAMFQEGHSASSCYHNYKKSLAEKYKSNFIQVSADNSIMPQYRWFFRQYQQFIIGINL